jgi:hypothetical protein
MIVEDMGPSVQHAQHLLGDTGGARQREILEMIGSGQRDVRGGDADDRAVEIPEGFVGDNGGDLRAPAAEPRVLFYREQSTRLRDRAEDGLSIERDQRPQVDDLRIDAMLVCKRLCRL